MKIPFDIVDEVVFLNDYISDGTINIAKEIEINTIIIHENNLGYVGKQDYTMQVKFSSKTIISEESTIFAVMQRKI